MKILISPSVEELQRLPENINDQLPCSTEPHFQAPATCYFTEELGLDS